MVTSTNFVLAQNKILNKKISVQAENERTKLVMNQISEKGRFYFSYNSDIIKGDKLVSIQRENTAIREIIKVLFDDEISALETGNYLILKKNNQPQEKEKVISKPKQKVKYQITVWKFQQKTIILDWLSRKRNTRIP